MLRVLHLGDLAREPERRLIRGFVDYAGKHGGFAIYPVSKYIADDPERYSEIIRKAKLLKVDAIIGGWKGINPEEALKVKIPIVLRTIDKEYRDFPMLSGDYRSIGVMAGEYLTKYNFASYSFIGFKDLLWSNDRYDGLKSVVEKKGLSLNSFFCSSPGDERASIAKWLKKLPKPAAVLACNDVMARDICEICHEESIMIPEELSLLGVDNDEFLCNVSYPGLSSVHLDFESQGRNMAKELLQMKASKSVWPTRIKVFPTCVVERASILKVVIKDPYIRRIVSFIEDNFASDISLSDIIADTPLSSRAIELRFKKELPNHTILSYLAEVRVTNMCRLLRTTDLSIAQIALESGFTDVLNVSRVFRKHCGMTPMEYRKKTSAISYE